MTLYNINLLIFLYLFLLFGIFSIYTIVYATTDDDESSKEIELCCTWGEKLADGVLTYVVKSANPTQNNIVHMVMAEWEQALDHFKFNEIKSSDSDNAEVEIKLKKGKGKQVGKTLVYFDSNGFIDHTSISISKRSFGVELNRGILEHVIKHEVGHALGLGHAKFKNTLMTNNVETLFAKIPRCEIEAVEFANEWKMINNDDSPSMKRSDEFKC